MKRRNLILGGTALVALGACSSSKFKRYNGPQVTYVIVNKGDRRMYLMHHDKVLESYDQKTAKDKNRTDWTWGCISVTNDEMEDIYAMVGNNTPIALNP
mgnify:CR=1 FL=1